MILQDLTSGGVYRDLPQIAFEAVTLLWHDDFWDGPLSGLLLWQGERLWFQMQEQYEPPDDADTTPWPWYRRYLVVRLTPEQLREEEGWHDLFRKCVGTHTDYQSNGQRVEVGAVQPKERHAEFYDAYSQRVPMNLTMNEVVGWFER
jgi:hypothetical protein